MIEKSNHCKVVSFANQKGGVAKSTTCCAFAAGLKRIGYRVLAIDCDPQGNLSTSVKAENSNSFTTKDVLLKKVEIKDAVQHLNCFDIIPANILLASAEVELVSEMGREQRLREAIEAVRTEYDYICLDAPPSLGVLTINALTASDELIIPSCADMFSASGIAQLISTIDSVKKYCNPNLKVAGILVTRYNPRTKNSKEMHSLIERFTNALETIVFETTIRESVVVKEAQAKQEPIFDHLTNRKESAITDYAAFIAEYLKREKDKQ